MWDAKKARGLIRQAVKPLIAELVTHTPES